MKNRVFAFFLILTTVLVSCFDSFGVTAVGKISSDQLAYENDLVLSTRPVTLTEDAVSTFTAQMNYDYKNDTAVSLRYDVGYPVYACDFNNGEVIESASANGTVTNTDGKLVLKGNSWMQSANLAENMRNFEMSFDIVCNNAWNNARIYLRGEWLYLNLRGYNTAGYTDNYIELKNRRNNTSAVSTVNPDGKRIRVLAVDDNIKIYADGELAIDYTYPKGASVTTGAIYLTNTELATKYDNMVIYALPNGSDDTYYQVDIGNKTTLSRYTNGIGEVLCEGDGLSEEKEYTFTLVRRQGTVELFADKTRLLGADIPPVQTDPVPVECGHIQILSSADFDSVCDVHIYNSAALNFTEDYAEILPIQTAADPELDILSQTGTSNDAAITFKDDGSLLVISPSELNKAVVTTDFLSFDASDVYIKFDVKTNRPDWTYDHFYFAGYTVYCGINGKGTASPCTAINPDGKNMVCDATYNYYAHSVYTMEFIRSGYRVEVYYYPKGSERRLLFQDFCFNQNVANFSIRKQQGSLTITNFEMCDCLSEKNLPLTGPKDGSGYVRCGDNITRVPYGITVGQFRKNMLSGNTLTFTKNSRTLNDDTVITTGTSITYNDYNFVWTAHTTYDINGDGDIDVKDVFIVRDCVNGGGTEIQKQCADTDLNGILNEEDITLVRNAALGGNGVLYTQPQTPTTPPTGGVENITTLGGKTLDVDINIRDFTVDKTNVAALQISVDWNGSNTVFADGSFCDYLSNKNTDIYTYFENGSFSVIYENRSSEPLFSGNENFIFGFDVHIPANTAGACTDLKITEFAIVFSDGTALETVSDNSAHIDVDQIGLNKQQTAPTPTLTARTETYFTLEHRVEYEYSIDGINWTDNPRFKHLETGKTYTVYQRIGAKGAVKAGDASAPLYVTLYKRGDVDTSGVRDAYDLAVMKRLLLGLDTNADMFSANANYDNTVDIRDLIKLKKLLINPDDSWVDPTVRGVIVIEE